MKYATLFNKKQTPQNMPIPGSGQSRNTAGGFTWQIDDWALLHRFLILGSESGTFYISPTQLTRSNAEGVIRLLQKEGSKVVQTVIDVSKSGRAPKNDPAIFAL